MKLTSVFLLISSMTLATPTAVLAANSFSYGENEVELYRNTFDSSGIWRLGQPDGNFLSNETDISISNGTLQNTTNTWQRTFLNFSDLGLNSLRLANGNIFVYLSHKTNKSSNESAKIYLELNSENTITNDPFYEQHHLAFNIRPTRNINTPYELYLDPAFYLPENNSEYQNYCQQWADATGSSSTECPYADPRRQDQLKQNLKPPSSFFDNPALYESLRLMVSQSPLDANLIEVTPQYWLNVAWTQFEPQNGSSVPLKIDLAQKICEQGNPSNCSNENLLLGQNSFKSLSLLFRSNVPTVDALAITQIPMEQIPEPLTILGAGTAAGLGAFFKRQINKKKKANQE
jgi:hypothetical protein